MAKRKQQIASAMCAENINNHYMTLCWMQSN